MAAGGDFDALPAQVEEFVEQGGELERRVLVAAWMGDDGHAAGAAYPAHGLGQGSPLHGHVARAIVAQELVENRLHVGAVAGLDQVAGEMRAADELGVARERQGALVRARHAHAGQALAHAAGAVGAAGARLAQAFDERGVGRVESQAHDVHRVAGPRHGDFDAGHEAHVDFARGLGRLGQAADLVVVGEGPDVHAIGVRAQRHLARRERAVRDGGMAMQVDIGASAFHEAIVEKLRRRG